MKRILIAGAGSYIGTALEMRMKQRSNEYVVETLDMKNSTWDKVDFSV